jgi:hypothetical protein
LLIKYVALGLFKVALIVFLPGYLLGATAGFFPIKSRRLWIVILLGSFFTIIETAIFIEKGLPFFFGNIYNMVSGYPRVAVQVAVGSILDGLWVWYTWRKTHAIAARITEH